MKKFLELDFSYTKGLLNWEEKRDIVEKAQQTLEKKEGLGAEFLGWLDLPEQMLKTELAQIEKFTQEETIQKADNFLVIGIGGSYIGARAIAEALGKDKEALLFAGQNMDGAYHQNLLKKLQGKSYILNIISKSGTTLEPSLAFRLFWDELSSHYSLEELRKRVFVTTDATKGSLRKFANDNKLSSFVIADDIGGRYSVFSSVALFPLMAINLPIREILRGASEMRSLLKTASFFENPALQYASYRLASYEVGYKIEILANYQSNLFYLTEWWKQLFGESEGKEGRGIFPSVAHFTTDLHSLGQWIQEGERSIFQTVLDVEKVASPEVPHWPSNIDNLNYLSGTNIHEINRKACMASMEAHHEGKVPCLRLSLEKIDSANIGALLYFFEYSCALSAYALGVNPFDQPGVEAYKKNMFRSLREC